MGSIGFLPKCIMFKFHMFINVALPQAKRLAIALHWLAQASSFAQIAALYAIGKSTVVAVIHQGIDVPRVKLVPEAIRFPTGSELEQVLVDFEALSSLPCCGGALDGTFMPIKKPASRIRRYLLWLQTLQCHYCIRMCSCKGDLHVCKCGSTWLCW